MNKNYTKLIEKLDELMEKSMSATSDLIINDLRKDGYSVVEVEDGGLFGDVEFNGSKYNYTAKPCSFIRNPLDAIGYILEPKKWKDILRTITQCVPNKDKYLIVMYAPISLDYLSKNVRFVSYFDVVEIK